MAKKRPNYAAPHNGSTPPKSAVPATPKQSPRDYILPLALGALYFVLAALSSAETIKTVAMICAIAALVACAARFKVLRERFGSPLLALTLFVTMGGVSTLYAISGKFALNEFLKVYASFCLTLILLAAAPGQGAKPGRWIATIVSVAGALFSLVSVDLMSTRIISTPILGFLGLFTSAFDDLSVVESGVRMVSMVDNPNVFAGTVGIGVLLSLGLAGSSESRTERNIHIVVLYINALAFILAFSMGATAAIAAGFVVCLLLERGEKRSALFILMLEALILVLVPTMLISQTSFTTWDGFDIVPTLCLVLGAAALVALDMFVGRRVVAWLNEKSKGKGRLMLALVGGAVAVVLVFGVLALTFTGSADLAAGESLRRAAYPDAGDYYLAYSASNGGATVVIESQNDVETMMHTSTVLYSGPLAGAEFTVPDGSKVVYFNVTAPDGGVTLDELKIRDSGAYSEKIPLDYKLLPGFIANRLQGLFANENAIQRLVFFEDGMKLFRRSPVVGLGLGAFENGIKNVQSFYYETKYAHNHYIQALAETGVIGFILFVALLVTSAVAILRTFRRENAHPLTPVLGGALAFMAIHAGTEVVFSFYSYLPMAYATFGLISLCCGDGLKLPLGRKPMSGVLAATAALVAAFAILLGGNMSAKSMIAEQATFTKLERAISLDRFEWADYMLSYVNGTMSNDVSDTIDAKAEKYAERLAEVNSNTIPRHLANYHFSRGEDAKAFEMIAKYCDYVSSDSEAWNNAFDIIEFYDDGTAEYRTAALAIVTQLETWEANNLGTITLNEKSTLYIDSLSE